jgi:hypothetical protein
MVISFFPRISHNCGKLDIYKCDKRFGGSFRVLKERFPQFQAIGAEDVGSKMVLMENWNTPLIPQPEM